MMQRLYHEREYSKKKGWAYARKAKAEKDPKQDESMRSVANECRAQTARSDVYRDPDRNQKERSIGIHPGQCGYDGTRSEQDAGGDNSITDDATPKKSKMACSTEANVCNLKLL